MANKYVETTETAAYLGVDGSNEAIVADLEVKIEIAEELIEDFCNQEFTYDSTPSSYTLNGNGQSNLILPKYLATLTAMSLVDSEGTSVGSYTLTDLHLIPANYNRALYSSIEFKDGTSFPAGVQNIVVTGTWGLQTIPKAIKLAVYLTVQNLYNLLDRDASLKSVSDIYRKTEYAGTDKLSRATNIVPMQAQMLLHRYQSVNKWLNSE